MDTLIFSASIGAGHDQVAKALQEEILRRYPAARVAVVDTISYINPVLSKVVLESYLGIVRYTPRVWAKLYETTEGDAGPELGGLPLRLLSRTLNNLISDFSPQQIICTHPFSAGLMAGLKRQQKIQQPLTTVITDFAVHSYWVHNGIDHYCIAHQDLAFLLEELQVPPSRIVPTGIPVGLEFSQVIDRQTALNELGLDDLPTVLVMGGSLGLGNIRQIVEQLDQAVSGIQILVVTGRNEPLRIALQGLRWRNSQRIYGYVDCVPDLMAVSHLVLTKAGGGTTAEALSQHKPLVIIASLPGQEHRNADFLTEHGAAIRLKEDKYVGQRLGQLLADRDRLDSLARMAAKLARRGAAAAVIDLVESGRN